MPKLQASGAFAQALDDNARALNGAYWKVYFAGTTTQATTYSNALLTIANAWPVIGDAAGRLPDIYVAPGNYRIRVETAGGVLIAESDNNVVYGLDPGEVAVAKFKTVAILQADATMAYAAGGGASIIVTVGDVIEADGHRYTVLASGATDAGRVENANAVKLKPLPSDGGLNVLAFNPDRTGVANSAAAFQAAHDALPSTGGVIRVPAGRYLWESSLSFTKPVTIVGEGSSATAGGVAATQIYKGAGVSGHCLKMSGLGSGLVDIGFEGVSGNTGDGIQVSCGRATLRNVSVHRMGQDGVRFGDADGTNVNLMTVDALYCRENGRHGVYFDDAGPLVPTKGPDCNGGTIQKVETSSNGGDGIRAYRCWYLTIIGDVPQVNAGIGLNIIGDGSPDFFGSRYHTVIGGEQNESNVGGNIANSGFRCTFLGVQPGATFTDAGAQTNVIAPGENKLYGLVSTNPIISEVASGVTNYPVVIKNPGNPLNGRGVGLELQTPNGSGTSRPAARIEAEQESTNNDYLRFSVNKDGTMVDILEISAVSSAVLPRTDGEIIVGSSVKQFFAAFFSQIVVNKGPTIRSGAGSPEGNTTAPVGSLWLRTDGGAGTSMYVKESGSGTTGWVAK